MPHGLWLWHTHLVTVGLGLSYSAACRILVPPSGIELIARWILNHWTTREVPVTITDLPHAGLNPATGGI